MTRDQIIHEVNVIFRDVLDDDSIIIKPETIADDVEDWDSLTHIQIVVAIEKHFKIKFSSSEIQGWKNAGDIFDSIAKRLAV
jgi:acyl carrier protein